MNITIGESIPDKFILLRKREKLSQRGLADKLGVSKSTVGHLESGHVKVISTEVFKKFAEHDELSKYALWLLDDQIDNEKAKAMTEFLREYQQTDESTPDE